MRRVMCLFLPQWPIDRRRGKTVSPAKPRVFVTSIAGRRVITAVDDRAAAAGLAPGMNLADARALCPDLDVAEADFRGDAAALTALARWCQRFSPWTAPYGADGILLDITGGAHLFGGEAALAAQIGERLARSGIACRVAIAATLGAAWALARFGGKAIAVASEGGTRAALAELGVAALRLDGEILSLLQRLGLRRIGDLYAMPRAALVARCGAGLVLRLDQALGLAPEPLAPLAPEKRCWSRRAFAEPIVTPEAIAATLRELLRLLCQRLATDSFGARKLVFALYRLDGRIEEAAIGTALPSRDPLHLERLFAEHLPRLDPGLGIEDAVLTAEIVEALAPAQSGFRAVESSGAEAEDAALAALIDRLANRLGPRSLARPSLQESHLPERTLHYRPVFAKDAGKLVPDLRQLRPVRLFPRPEPVEAMAPVPDDPPLWFRWRHIGHRVRRADGPERIAGEWWREESPPRDYYRVEDEEGRRFWLYRCGLYQPQARPQWFLHGIFG